MWALAYDGNENEFDQVHVAGIKIAGHDYRTEDTAQVQRDGLRFGSDYADPGDIVIALSVNSGAQLGDAEARRIVRERATAFTALWDAPLLRSQPGLVAELHADELGVFEGRPRGVEWDWSRYAAGFLPGRARWVRSSAVSYIVGSDGEVWHEQTVGMVPAQIGGLVAPLVAPLTTAAESSRARTFTVGGDSPAWGIYTVTGPLAPGARVELTGRWSAHLNRVLAYDEVIQIDTRPGQRLMTVNESPRNVLLPSGARMSEMSMNPGVNEIALRGTSIDGTARLSVRWRDTRGS